MWIGAWGLEGKTKDEDEQVRYMVLVVCNDVRRSRGKGVVPSMVCTCKCGPCVLVFVCLHNFDLRMCGGFMYTVRSSEASREHMWTCGWCEVEKENRQVGAGGCLDTCVYFDQHYV